MQVQETAGAYGRKWLASTKLNPQTLPQTCGINDYVLHHIL